MMSVISCPHYVCMWAVMLEGGGVWGHCITLCFNIRRGETTGGFNEMFGIFPGMFVKKKKKKKRTSSLDTTAQ